MNVNNEDVILNKSFQAKISRTPIKSSQINLLKKGDHVGWHRWYIIWHHAIVVKTDEANNRINVIHFDKDSNTGKMTIKEEWKDLDNQGGDFFRFDYTNDTVRNNPPDGVVKRARDKLGETGYNFLTNNCEHFATFCKTGRRLSHQVYWAAWKFIEIATKCPVFMATSYIKLKDVLKKTANQTCQPAGTDQDILKVYEVIKDAMRQLCESADENTTAGASKSLQAVINICIDIVARTAKGKMTSALAKEVANQGAAGSTVDLVCIVLAIAIDVSYCAYDIYQMDTNINGRTITFKKCVTQRVFEAIGGVCDIAGGKIGWYIGGLFGKSACAVVGSCGCVVAVGSLVGTVCGSIFGHWLGGFFRY